MPLAPRLVSLTNHRGYYKSVSTRQQSVVGIATRYGMEGPEIESRLDRDIPHPSIPTLRVHPASYTMGTGSFPGVQRIRRGGDYPSPPSAEVKEQSNTS